MNLYVYAKNNPVYYTDPSGYEVVSPAQRHYQDVGADPETAKLATECYPDKTSKADLYNKYKAMGYDATNAKMLADYEIIHGKAKAENFAANNVKKAKGSTSNYTIDADGNVQKIQSGYGNKGGRTTTGKTPVGVTYEGALYRNVGTMPDGTPVNPLEISDFTNRQNYRYTQNGQNGLYFASSQHVMEGEMGAYGSNPYADNRTTYHYDNVSLNNMLDLSNPNTRAELGVDLADLISSDYKSYTTPDTSPAVTHSMGNYAAQNGYTGLIVPSARADGGINIVIFNPKGIDFGTYTTIHDRQ